METEIFGLHFNRSSGPGFTVGPVPSGLEGVCALVLGVETADGVPTLASQKGLIPSSAIQYVESLLPALVSDWSPETALTVLAPEGVEADLLTLVGVGDAARESKLVRYRRASGVAARSASSADRVLIALPVDSEAEVAAVLEGALLGSYTTFRMVGERSPAPKSVPAFHIVTSSGDVLESGAVRSALESVRAVNEARTLVNLPPNKLYPDSFARLAVSSASDIADLTVTVWDEGRLHAEGFGGLIGVGQGSAKPPRLVKMSYHPPGASKHLALVGKGITFDAGGINIKTAALDYMHYDMSGAAAVMGAVLATARLALKVRVTAWLALAENMPSATAQRPTDVVTMRDGTTVEVRDTDAEGRLVLADAISAACAENPDVLLDIATLTGAQEVALGARTAAMMSNSPELVARLARVVEHLDEPHWEMPLLTHLRSGLNSPVADLCNLSAERGGGMLRAGVFLQHFVDGARSVPAWAHFDVAGPAINRREPYGFTPLGGTGVGVRTIVALAADLAR